MALLFNSVGQYRSSLYETARGVLRSRNSRLSKRESLDYGMNNPTTTTSTTAGKRSASRAAGQAAKRSLVAASLPRTQDDFALLKSVQTSRLSSGSNRARDRL